MLLRDKVWFPGMNQKVIDMVAKYVPCQAVEGQQVTHPVLMNKMPEAPWQELAMDFYGPLRENGRYLMVVTDTYSRYPIVHEIASVSAEQVKPVLKETFAMFGIPELVKSDNGAPFNGHVFDEFARFMGFKHRKVTPYHARSNGLVERFMKNLTKIRIAAKIEGVSYRAELTEFLANYRNTTHPSTGKTPTSLMFQYESKTSRLVHNKQVIKTKNMIEAEKADVIAKAQMKYHKDSCGRVKVVQFKAGDIVRVRNQHLTNKLVSKYSVDTYRVKIVCGTRITAENDNHTIVRDISQFKHAAEEFPSIEPKRLLTQQLEQRKASNEEEEEDCVIIMPHAQRTRGRGRPTAGSVIRPSVTVGRGTMFASDRPKRVTSKPQIYQA